MTRSPREILRNKAELERVSEIKERPQSAWGVTESFLEWEIGMRLLYIRTVNDERTGRGGLESWYQNLHWRLETARVELCQLHERKWNLENRTRILKQDQECLRSLIQANDEETLSSLARLQDKLKRVESKLADVALQAGVEVLPGSFVRVFSLVSQAGSADRVPMMLPPPSHIPASCPPQFGDLLPISGQMEEFVTWVAD